MASLVRPRLWLRWVFPAYRSAIALDHGLEIGRDAECDVRLDGRGVSRRHSICSNPLKTDEYPQVQTMFWSSSRPLGVPSEAF